MARARSRPTGDGDDPAPAGPAAAPDPADLAWDVFDRGCPSRLVLDDVTGRWGLLALAALVDGSLRFAQLRRRVDGVSDKMLAKALQALERDGLVLRTQRSVMPPAVDYELTPLGAAAARQTAALVQWLEDHMDDIATAQTRYDQAGGRSAAR